MIRVLHTGDLHIGSYPGPEVNGENARYLDICRCLDALVAGARQQQPDIAVIAGDIFHAFGLSCSNCLAGVRAITTTARRRETGRTSRPL